ERRRRVAPLLVLGLNHEQQHQELILTDVKHLLSLNPLRPPYRPAPAAPPGAAAPPVRWSRYAGGGRWIGHEGPGFAYDTESPRHRQFVAAFRLAGRLVSNGEYLAFLQDGGYDRPELW